MKRFCALLLGLNLTSALAADDVLADYEFRAAVREGSVSMHELARRLKAEAAKPGGTESREFVDLFAAATAKANDAELKELGEMIRALPENGLQFSECFSAYATRKIRLQIAKLRERPARVDFRASAEEPPKELADAPPAFRAAWRLHRSVIAPYEALFAPPGKADAPRKKTPPLETELRKFIGDPEPGAWKVLLDHEWGHWCGTGSESLYHPRNRALLIAFLAEGKLQEAAGAALAQVPSMNLGAPQESFDSAIIELFTALGVDWEQVALGSLLPVNARNVVNGRAVMSNPFGEFDAWRMLSARGSANAIDLCLQLIRWVKADPGDAGDFLASALGPEPKRENVVSYSSHPRLERETPLPEKTRTEVSSLFSEYLAAKNTPADLMDAMRTIPTHVVRDLRGPLAALVSHPVHVVGARALSLLRDAGLATGKETLSPAPAPLRFRLLLNGKPLPSVEVSLNAYPPRAAEAKAAAPLSADVSVASTGPARTFFRALVPEQHPTTDPNGEVRLSLKECLDPEGIGSVQLHMGPSPFDTEFSDDFEMPRIRGEERPRRDPTEWPGPWVLHQINVRAGSEELHEVSLRGADLEVKLGAFPDFASDTPVKVFLSRVNSRHPFSRDAGVAKATGRAGNAVFFRRLQAGKYEMTIRAPGAADYESGEITVNDQPVTREVKLEPGRSVRGTAVYPDGNKTSLHFAARLFRDGREIHRHGYEGWSGLPFGKYTARIPSTRETEKANVGAGIPKSTIPAEDRVGGRDIPFVIDASTPAVLDLGEISIPPEKR